MYVCVSHRFRLTRRTAKRRIPVSCTDIGKRFLFGFFRASGNHVRVRYVGVVRSSSRVRYDFWVGISVKRAKTRRTNRTTSVFRVVYKSYVSLSFGRPPRDNTRRFGYHLGVPYRQLIAYASNPVDSIGYFFFWRFELGVSDVSINVWWALLFRPSSVRYALHKTVRTLSNLVSSRATGTRVSFRTQQQVLRNDTVLFVVRYYWHTLLLLLLLCNTNGGAYVYSETATKK